MAGHGNHEEDETGRLECANRADNLLDNHEARLDLLEPALEGKQSTSQKGQANGYAGLDATGKVPSGQIPAIAVNDTFAVANQAEMLALAASPSDVAFRQDVTDGFFQLISSPASTLGNWVKRSFAGSGVTSINGTLTGAVTGIETVARRNAANGYAGLDATGKVSATQLPADSTVVSHVNEYHPYDFRKWAPINAGTNGLDCTDALAQALTALAATTSDGQKLQQANTGAYQRGNAAPGGAYGIHVTGGMFTIGNLPNDINCHRATLFADSWGAGFIRKAGTSGTWFETQRDANRHVSLIQLRGMTLHGNAANQVAVGNCFVSNGEKNFVYTSGLDEDFDVHNYVTNCQIIDFLGDGLRAEGSGGCRFSNNRIRSIKSLGGAGGIGIYVDFDNHVEGNDIGWTDKQGIVHAGDSCGIFNNKCWYSGRASSTGVNGQGILCNADSGILSGNWTQDTRAQGLLLDGANNVTVSGINI